MNLDPAARPITAQRPATSAASPAREPERSAQASCPSAAAGKPDAFVGPRADPPSPIIANATPNAKIGDLSTISSTIHLDNTASVDKLKLDLDISHTYRGDLVVTLTSPSGKSAVVSDRAGGSADDIKGSFDLTQFAGEPVAGDWKLSVQDAAKQDVGTLNKWGLTIQPKSDQPPPPPPVKDDSDP